MITISYRVLLARQWILAGELQAEEWLQRAGLVFMPFLWGWKLGTCHALLCRDKEVNVRVCLRTTAQCNIPPFTSATRPCEFAQIDPRAPVCICLFYVHCFHRRYNRTRTSGSRTVSTEAARCWVASGCGSHIRQYGDRSLTPIMQKRWETCCQTWHISGLLFPLCIICSSRLCGWVYVKGWGSLKLKRYPDVHWFTGEGIHTPGV